MTAPATALAEQPSPATALQQRFQHIWRQQMQDVPIVNPALAVEALGFRPWREHWLGVLVTPWFMNLWLMPRVVDHWQEVGERESRHHVFPAGVFEFIGGRDAVIGPYQACSLFSPMFDFADAAGAHDTALASLDALFDAANRQPGEVTQLSAAAPHEPTPLSTAAAQPAASTAAPAPAQALSKRDFLFGHAPRAHRGP